MSSAIEWNLASVSCHGCLVFMVVNNSPCAGNRSSTAFDVSVYIGRILGQILRWTQKPQYNMAEWINCSTSDAYVVLHIIIYLRVMLANSTFSLAPITNPQYPKATVSKR